jgi:hypothetical protein
MKAADWTVRALVAATFIVSMVAPDRFGFPLGIACLGAVGAFAIVYPQGILGWVKKAHPMIDAMDPSLHFIPRLIGGFFVAFALVIAALSFRR